MGNRQQEPSDYDPRSSYCLLPAAYTYTFRL